MYRTLLKKYLRIYFLSLLTLAALILSSSPSMRPQGGLEKMTRFSLPSRKIRRQFWKFSSKRTHGIPI